MGETGLSWLRGVARVPLRRAMSALGHEQKWCHARVMSVIPLKADIHQRGLHVR
jgi:hypothetical protein